MSKKVQYLYCKTDGSYYFRRNIPLTLASYYGGPQNLDNVLSCRSLTNQGDDHEQKKKTAPQIKHKGTFRREGT